MDGFRWQDGERTIRFGRGCVQEATELLGGSGYVLLTTERAAAMAPGVLEAAGAVHHVGSGRVDELAAGLLGVADGPAEGGAAKGGAAEGGAAEGGTTRGGEDRIVALGGGRVVDTAKAIVAVRGGRAMAVPTTLSGAEMTRTHRMPAGVDASSLAPVRCAVVVNDPALCASQPVDALAASALNALGHVAEGPCTPMANPVGTLAALEGGRLLVRAFDGPEPDRDALALGALLAGYAIDAAGYGLHHVLSQTLARLAGAGHSAANAIMLQHTLGALAWRFPRQLEALRDAIGEDPSEAAARLGQLTGATTLGALGIDHDTLAACADAAAGRAELDLTPPRAGRAELLALYEAAS